MRVPGQLPRPHQEGTRAIDRPGHDLGILVEPARHGLTVNSGHVQSGGGADQLAINRHGLAGFDHQKVVQTDLIDRNRAPVALLGKAMLPL